MSGVTNDLIKKSKEISENFLPSEYDVLVSSGEQVACSLIAARLTHIGLKSRSWLSWQIPIITEGSHKNAKILSVYKKKILDYLMKANVAHHNHHMNPKMNHRAIPLRHLFSRNSIIKDIEIYTKMRKITMTIDNFY